MRYNVSEKQGIMGTRKCKSLPIEVSTWEADDGCVVGGVGITEERGDSSDVVDDTCDDFVGDLVGDLVGVLPVSGTYSGSLL